MRSRRDLGRRSRRDLGALATEIVCCSIASCIATRSCSDSNGVSCAIGVLLWITRLLAPRRLVSAIDPGDSSRRFISAMHLGDSSRRFVSAIYLGDLSRRLLAHLVELVDANNAAVSDHHCATLEIKLARARVLTKPAAEISSEIRIHRKNGPRYAPRYIAEGVGRPA